MQAGIYCRYVGIYLCSGHILLYVLYYYIGRSSCSRTSFYIILFSLSPRVFPSHSPSAVVYRVVALLFYLLACLSVCLFGCFFRKRNVSFGYYACNNNNNNMFVSDDDIMSLDIYLYRPHECS